jgi:hypothetical protein
MNPEEKARALLSYLEGLCDFLINKELDYGNYRHMGATITAAILQAGVNWYATVKPRVDRLRSTFPEAATTTGFLELLDQRGHVELLDWNDKEKPNRILGLARFLQEEKVENEAELQNWLREPENGSRLMGLRGVGDKTVDFLQMLVGIPTNAVDRHLYGLLSDAGIDAKGYQEAHEIIDRAADLAGIDRIVFDFSIWKYMSGKSKNRKRKTKEPPCQKNRRVEIVVKKG